MRNIERLSARASCPSSQREARARGVVSRARRPHRSLSLSRDPAEARGHRPRTAPSVSKLASTCRGHAMSDSSAQRVRVGPFAVSVDKQKPLIGAKISKVRTAPSASARAARLSVPPRAGTKGATRPANREPRTATTTVPFVTRRTEKVFFSSFFFLVTHLLTVARALVLRVLAMYYYRASRTPPGTPP